MAKFVQVDDVWINLDQVAMVVDIAEDAGDVCFAIRDPDGKDSHFCKIALYDEHWREFRQHLLNRDPIHTG